MKKYTRYEMDMTSGNFFWKIFAFSIPLMLTGVLQLFYNAADLIIVSNFSNEKDAIGAVGSTSSLISLLVNLFMGLSVGTSVLVARYFAADNKEKVSKCVHTAVIISFVSGLVLGILGFIFAKQFLQLMDNPIPLAVTYLKIYFIGMPFNMLYNFAASILRGVGDTRRPLIYLAISGLINVMLNLFFVIVLKMDVDGVALATIISQFISCFMIMNCLMKTKQMYRFSFKEMSISKEELIEMVRIGLPAGIQSSIFSISNVIIQSTVNKFGAIAINGNAAAQSIEGFVYVGLNAVSSAALSFMGQNMGVKKYENIKKITFYCLLNVVLISVVLGVIFFSFGRTLATFYTKVPTEIDVAYIRLHYLCLPYFLCGIMDVMVGILRGMGHSVKPMIVSIVGVCGFRIFWIYTVFYHLVDFSDVNSLHYLYVSYPISWIITFSVHFGVFLYVYNKIRKEKINPKLV